MLYFVISVLHYFINFQIIDKDINPYVDSWEKEGQYPAKNIYKKLAEAGLLGITRSPGKLKLIIELILNS